ncbi:hypothetical protein VKT23_004988 [Stygiomarasmius scandens]|uniref:F-box domain-containing protein n=1 Tax=Marasmiellus scandens TaxID=2682957 RepID=A0ABR1JXN5_9AGAR
MSSVGYQNTPSTILDLPPEILAEIFHISCDYNIIDPICSSPPSPQFEESHSSSTVSVSNSDSSISPPSSRQSEESESHPIIPDSASPVSPPFPQPEESKSPSSTVSILNSASSVDYDVSQMSSLAVSMVCSTWRAIALSIPSIWACIDVRYFHDGSDPEFTQQAILHFLQMYLSRSGHHHLTLNVTRTFPQYYDSIFQLPKSDSYCYRILDSLCKESHRWYDVTFDISPDTPEDETILSHPPFTTIRGKLPLLEKLNLAGFPPDGLVLDIFQTCPRLNTLSSFAWAYPVPRQNLKRVELADTYDYSIIIDQALLEDLFLSCPNLDELIIRTSFYGLPKSVIPVTSMSIRSLYAAQGTYGGGKPLWCLITLPKLEKLTMNLFHGISSRFNLPMTEFSEFLVRSGCNITSLTLPGLEHKCDDSIISLLHLLRLSLKRLAISETYRDHPRIVISQKLLETIISAQKANSDVPSNNTLTPSELKYELFLPCLETLELRINRSIVEQLRESIQRVIQSSSVTRLRDFKLFILGGYRSALLRSDSQLFDLLHSMERPKDLIYSVYYR